MNIVTHREIPENNFLREGWNLLAEKMQPAEIFYTHEWALAVARAYSDSRSPLLVLGYTNGVLVGVAALAVCDNQRIEFLNANTADYCDFISSPDNCKQFASRAFEEIHAMGMQSIVLANLPSDSRTATMLCEAARDGRFYMFSQKAYDCCQVELATPLQRESVRRSLAEKKGVRRDVAALSRLGELKLEHHRHLEDVAHLLPEFYRAHVARFLDKGGISNIARPQRRAFLSELARLLSDVGAIRLTSLAVGERKIAWNYGFEFAGSWFWYQPTFDTALSKYFPGFCLLTMLVAESAGNENIQRVDLGLGEERYKARLATAHRETLHVTLSRSYSSYLKTSLRASVIKRVKQRPKLERILRRIVRPGRGSQDRKSAIADLSEWKRPDAGDNSDKATSVKPLTLDLLARVIMRYVEDAKTVDYVLNAASRLKSSAPVGFAAVDEEGMPLKIFWIAECDKAAKGNIQSLQEAKI